MVIFGPNELINDVFISEMQMYKLRNYKINIIFVARLKILFVCVVKLLK